MNAMAAQLAVGVLSAKAPAILEQTLSNWAPELCTVYVHVDAKFDLADYAFLERYPHVRLVEPRVEVFWGGFSMVEAEFRILTAALRDGFEFIALQSDDAIPLMSPQQMLHELRQAERWKPVGTTSDPGIRSRYDNLYCLDASAPHPLIGKFDIERADVFLLAQMLPLAHSGKYPLKDLYWSSQWKCLSFDDVAYLVGAHEKRGHLYESFRFSMIPDEHYVPTLLSKGPRGSHAVERLLWTDFTRHPRPYVFQSADELEPAREQGFLFIRKVHDPAVAQDAVSRIRQG